MSTQTSVIAAKGANWAGQKEEEEAHQEYRLFSLRHANRSVGSTHHRDALDLKINNKAKGTDITSWAPDIRNLRLQAPQLSKISSISISGPNAEESSPQVPVQLLTALCNSMPQLQHLECTLPICGSEQEFQEWANSLPSGLTHVILRLSPGTSTIKEPCTKWEPVILSMLACPNLQEVQVDWKGSTEEAFRQGTSHQILQKAEQDPNKIALNFPLSFHSLKKAARYLKASRPLKGVVNCDSPLNKESFMGRFFESHNLPEIPECSLHITGRGSSQTTSTTIFVTVSKRKLSDPQQLQRELQNLLGPGRHYKVTPPVISKVELFLNPNYLKSRYIYGQFPEELWDVSATRMGSDYRQMVSLLHEGRVLGKHSTAALYEWFSAHPSHLAQLNY